MEPNTVADSTHGLRPAVHQLREQRVRRPCWKRPALRPPDSAQLAQVVSETVRHPGSRVRLRGEAGRARRVATPAAPAARERGGTHPFRRRGVQQDPEGGSDDLETHPRPRHLAAAEQPPRARPGRLGSGDGDHRFVLRGPGHLGRGVTGEALQQPALLLPVLRFDQERNAALVRPACVRQSREGATFPVAERS